MPRPRADQTPDEPGEDVSASEAPAPVDLLASSEEHVEGLPPEGDDEEVAHVPGLQPGETPEETPEEGASSEAGPTVGAEERPPLAQVAQERYDRSVSRMTTIDEEAR